MKLIDIQSNKINKMNKTLYLIYARKSTESEDKQCASIDNQLEVLNELAKQRNLPVLKTFTESKSAKAPGRIVFNEMLDLISKQDNIKGIISWKLNRLSRNPIDSGTLQWLLQSQKIEEIVTPSKIYLEGDSDFIMAVEGAQANRFIRDLREDTKRGIDRKLEMGIAPILAPAGYINDKTKNQGERDILPHPKYFPLMRKIFSMALTGRYSVAELLRKANEMEIRTNRNNQLISRTQIYRILKDPFYTGRFLYRGMLHQGSHTPMVSDMEFDSIQEVLEGRSNVMQMKHDFPLKGMILCGVCKKWHLVGERHIKRSGLVFDYYKCSGHAKGKCLQPYISATELEKQVYDFLGTIKVSNKLLSVAVKWLRKTEDTDKVTRNLQFEELRKQQKELEKKIDNLTASWLSSDNTDKSLLTDEEFKSIKQSLFHQKMQILDKLNNKDIETDTWTDIAIETFKFASEAQGKWDTGTLEDKKTILSVVGSNLVLRPGKKLDITPRTPFLLINRAISKENGKLEVRTPDLRLSYGESTPKISSWVTDDTRFEPYFKLFKAVRDSFTEENTDNQILKNLLLSSSLDNTSNINYAY